jgi:hypothetical protein
MSLEEENLRRSYVALCARVRTLEKHIDTVSSPMWKRLCFVIRGYRFRRLGRWYAAPWNENAREYDQPE